MCKPEDGCSTSNSSNSSSSSHGHNGDDSLQPISTSSSNNGTQQALQPYASPASYDASETNTILYLRGCTAWFIEFSPAVQPRAWLIINLLFCVASLMVFLDVVLSLHKLRAQVIAEELFLVYNCTSTAIWCLEMTLTVLQRRVTEQFLTWPIRLEVCFALFFFYDSVQLISAWRVHDDEVARQDVRSSLINTFAYLYVSCEMWMRVRQQSSGATIIGLSVYNRMDSEATLQHTNKQSELV